jgi:DNA adenine methylase
MVKTISRDFSPLRFPGSKQRIAPYLESILSYNSITPDVIIEPFVGGGSVFLYFILLGIAKKAIISDKDKLISSFWKTVFGDQESLIDFVSNTPIDLKTYYHFKAVAENHYKHTSAELANACLFLNRTSFSGIISSSAGPIGGKAQKSDYSIDCRFNRQLLKDKISLLSSYSSSVTVLEHDWKSTINYSLRLLKSKKKSLVPFYYLDPPFYFKADSLYRCYFDHSDHLSLNKLLLSFDKPWILSYDNTEQIRQLYTIKSLKPIHVELPYSINHKAKRIVKELIITRLNIPETKSLISPIHEPLKYEAEANQPLRSSDSTLKSRSVAKKKIERAASEKRERGRKTKKKSQEITTS